MLRGTTTVAGVWGWPVKHSASPAMHNAAYEKLGLDWVYVPFSVNPEPENVERAVAGVRAFGLAGINVTVPLKELVIPHLDFLTPRAEAIGAVNTLFWDGDKGDKLGGDSTDGPGFLAALEIGGMVVDNNTRAIVLGAGGSARAVVYALAERGATVTIANRTPEKSRALQERFASVSRKITVVDLSEEGLQAPLKDAQLLVNTTSIGMSPNVDAMPPVPRESLTPSLFVSDLIYNPAETKLLATAREAGCLTQNGIEMLVQQGAIALTHWTGQPAPLATMRQAVLDYLKP
jgi:shikimate dehydrogenase